MCEPTFIELPLIGQKINVRCNRIEVWNKKVNPGTRSGDRNHWNHFHAVYEVMDQGGAHYKALLIECNGKELDTFGNDVYRGEAIREIVRKAHHVQASCDGEVCLEYIKGHRL